MPRLGIEHSRSWHSHCIGTFLLHSTGPIFMRTLSLFSSTREIFLCPIPGSSSRQRTREKPAKQCIAQYSLRILVRTESILEIFRSFKRQYGFSILLTSSWQFRLVAVPYAKLVTFGIYHIMGPHYMTSSIFNHHSGDSKKTRGYIKQ